MKRIVSNDYGFGAVLAVPAVAIVAITGAGAAGAYLICIICLMVGLIIKEPPERIQRWRKKRGRA